MVEVETWTEPGGKGVGVSVTWWDANVRGYRAIQCTDLMPGGCIVVSRPAKWEGNDFVSGDEYSRDGKKYIFREVVSQITPTSYARTLSSGEEGKDLRRQVTVHAVKESAATATSPPKTK
jgi:hypothetical protein